ncbi:hypothetical protein AHAS_Ahas18G0236600 [Arachis hypogaea]
MYLSTATVECVAGKGSPSCRSTQPWSVSPPFMHAPATTDLPSRRRSVAHDSPSASASLCFEFLIWLCASLLIWLCGGGGGGLGEGETGRGRGRGVGVGVGARGGRDGEEEGERAEGDGGGVGGGIGAGGAVGGGCGGGVGVGGGGGGGAPVHYQWMYPIERYLCRFKQYVRNRTQPEGSIAEEYLSEKILTFCSRYLDNVETRLNRPTRVDDRPNEAAPGEIASMFSEVGKAVGATSFFSLTATENLQAHRHVPLGSTNHSNELQWLACGPIAQARRFKAYNVNGFKFRTMSREERMKTQNSGVYVTSDTRSYASKRDSNVAVGGVSYYKRLVDIIELNYSGQFTVVLFKCLWADTTSGRGIRQDVLGHTCVNFANPIHTGDRKDDEPYILASEARLVFYVDDEVDNGWSVVVHVKPRDLFDMGEDYEQCDVDLHPQPCMTSLPEFDVEGLRLTRDGDLEESTDDGVEDCDEAANS